MLSLGDIYYVLFRHKWKIIVISGVGVIIGLMVRLLAPVDFESEAKLLIKYVLDSRVPSDPGGNEARVTLPDAAGRNIINTELQILTSLDLAQEVATNVGPDRILGKTRNVSVAAAAVAIHNNLSVEVANNSDVIRIVYKHSDPALVREILEQIISTYKERHAEIHRPGGDDDILTQERDQLKTRLKQTEDALSMAKTNLDIVSLDEARNFFSQQSRGLQTDLYNSETELAEHQAVLDELSKHVKAGRSETNVGQAATSTDSVSSDKIARYKRVCDMLDAFRNREKELRLEFLPDSTHIKDIEVQVTLAEKQKEEMEQETPGLIAVNIKSQDTDSNAGAPASDFRDKLITEKSLIAGLQKKIQVLTNELANLRERSAAVEAGANAITELERTRKLEEEHLTYYSESLENSRIDEALGPGKGSNINEIQSPSPAFLDNSKIKKASLGICFGGIVIALGLAFLIEMYLDRTVKRPVEIENRLGVPLLMSIPYRNGNGHQRLLTAPARTGLIIKSEQTGRSVPLLGGRITLGRGEDNTFSFPEGSISVHHCEILVRDGQAVARDLGSSNGTFVDGERIKERALEAGQTLSLGEKVELEVKAEEIEKPPEVLTVPANWSPRHALRPFYDALRDRLITYFEVRNLKHKPKLVALTSCGEGAGVTSVATGLAASLSETGEGNVLLVDMKEQNGGAAHYFHKGRLAFGLDDALRKEKRHEALVQNNLYVVTEGSEGEYLGPLLPKRFTTLVPQLRASDYDYIIFDMPSLSQISVTPRLARFMDMVMVVVESEKTDRDIVQRAVSMLAEVPVNVGVVLNKRKTYVPQRLQQEL
jgi:uncharacterized protein involved in exopolysaccharide biosynthesis/Mrp family chromosome partitioning ATPase